MRRVKFISMKKKGYLVFERDVFGLSKLLLNLIYASTFLVLNNSADFTILNKVAGRFKLIKVR